MARFKAAGLHLLVSVVVIGLVLLGVTSLWYPTALLPMSGIIGLLLLIAAVDVLLGPFLTLVVYKQGKSSLKFDLAVIVALQLSMLGYGLHVLAQNRPAFMVATPDRLTLVRAFEIDSADLSAAQPPNNRLPWTGARWVGARPPADPEQRSQLLTDALAGRDLFVQPRYFIDFESLKSELLTEARPLTDLSNGLTLQERRRLENALSNGTDMANGRYLIVNSSRGAALLLIDPEGNSNGFVAIDPYEVRTRSRSSALPLIASGNPNLTIN